MYLEEEGEEINPKKYLKVVGIDWVIKRKNSGAINPVQLMKPKQHSCKKWSVKASIDL
jgi:hypothetical protein